MHDFVLLDTDVASYLFKRSPRALAFRALLEGKQTALAFVSVAELFKWTVKRRWSEPKVEQSARKKVLGMAHQFIPTRYPLLPWRNPVSRTCTASLLAGLSFGPARITMDASYGPCRGR